MKHVFPKNEKKKKFFLYQNKPNSCRSIIDQYSHKIHENLTREKNNLCGGFEFPQNTSGHNLVILLSNHLVPPTFKKKLKQETLDARYVLIAHSNFYFPKEIK